MRTRSTTPGYRWQHYARGGVTAHIDRKPSVSLVLGSVISMSTPVVAGIDLGWLGGGHIANKGGKTLSHMALADRLNDPEEFGVFFSWNTNPLASAPEQQKLRKALERENLFTVVCDVFMTDTAAYADIVLPAASFLEYNDITFSYFHLHMGAQAKVSEPMGDSLPNAEIFRRLAQAMNLDEPALFETDAEIISIIMNQMKPAMSFGRTQKTRLLRAKR